MQEAKKAKGQPIDELAYLRRRVAELERSEQERKRDEDRLRESERRLSAFLRNAPIHRFLLLDSALDIVAGNDIVLDLFSTFFGLKKEEIIGKNFPELIPGFDASDRHKKYLEVLRTGTPFYTEELAPPPEAGDVRISVSVFKAGDGLGIIATDITERVRVERALRESEERYRIFFDESPTALWEIDASYVKEFTDQLRKTGVRDFKAYFEDHPEEAVTCEKEVKLVEMNRASLELFESSGLELSESGGREEILQSLRRIVPREESKVYSGGILAVAKGRTSFQEKLVLNTPKGKKKQILYKWSVLPGHEGSASRLLVSLVDITASVQLEQERLKSQKLESLGVLAGGIAHDFNNFLTAISTNISMALIYGDLEDDISEMLGDAEKASNRAKNLTQQLLAFAKGGKPIKRTVSMGKLLRDTVEFALSGSNVQSLYSVPEDLWPVFVDEGQIGQVIHNLVINADQAMPGGGKVEIAAENVLVDREKHLSLNKGKYVRLSVTDHGIGISGKHLDSIFDPFFTTKQKGSGLGLTTCFTIMKNHGGKIRAHSEVDAGTRIDVFLPASEEALEGGKRDKAIAMNGEGRILLIDDEEMIRRSAGEMLRRFGYDVTSAKDGEEAIRYYQEASASEQPFDAVIMDLTIRGGKGGQETIEELMTMDPDAKVIVSSGYSDDPVMSHFEEYGFRDVITKPYKLDEVGRVLRRVLSGARG